jgi:predicted PurR-regulated permease PerM
MPTLPPLRTPQVRFLTFIASALLFLYAVRLGLIIPIYAGLLVYVLVKKIAGRIVTSKDNLSTWIALSLVTAVVVLGLIGIGFGLHVMLARGGDVNELALRMSEILASARSWLPEMVRSYVPEEQDILLAHAGEWLREHAAQIGTFSLSAITGLTLGLIGLLLGALTSVGTAIHPHRLGPITQQLFGQVGALRESFWRVASAQVKISSLNTLLTGLYLAVILPAFGVHLPFTKTLIVITFIAGLLPVVGNLISNTVITIISLSHSLAIAVASLGFLVVIHKLEYFANARFVGEQIDAKAFELLLAMLFMERLLGPAGVVAAPVFYAWLKSEWVAWDRPAPAEQTA